MTYNAKGKKMWKYPANSTIKKLKQLGYRQIVWRNGDFLSL